MVLKQRNPKQALNKAFLKVKPNRTEIEFFKTHLKKLIESTNHPEFEEFHKNLVSDFLKNSYYKQNHFINTKKYKDLVIHNGQTIATSVGVIIETKNPTHTAGMVTRENLNAKAFQELVLYYLEERITLKNIELKHLVATNINEWFIFDATLFDRLFAQNKKLVKQFNDFKGGRLADDTTDFFYKDIAKPFIDEISEEIAFTYFNIQDFVKPLNNSDKADDHLLIALFKLLSPEHLLKLPFANDSNSLDKGFYSELLHIIGLTETKDGGKKLIERNKAGERNPGTILEDAIIQLQSLDKLSRLENPNQFGSTPDEQLFHVALELSITWINRILFLKLLEAQLISYHKGDPSYSFLNIHKIKNYDDLNSLFFQVLACKFEDRKEVVQKAFKKVPYLNSSLFEPTEMEHKTLLMSNLKGNEAIPIISSTVLKDLQGKKRTGRDGITALEYLFEFLNAYDFSSEGSEEIQEEKKTLISASVLGLIFEKINGYKDGSFFTPGSITMYMCRESIRKAVLQKFNATKNWNCTSITELYNKIEIDDIKEANKIVNSIKVCDPAVGSGHFLVSALNEIIAIKHQLKILQDRKGKRLKEYVVEVVNDELIVTHEDGKLFEYKPTIISSTGTLEPPESQRIQETLFHEKQTIIENCLFGVDINTNSVKICRLRLWIELLKNAYYKTATELETLPNIDINIKCGNSLVSRFAIDADLRQALANSKWKMDTYRAAVDTYRNAKSKEQKKKMERIITEIKSGFRIEISQNAPIVKKKDKLTGELSQMTNQGRLFELSEKEKADWNNKVQQLDEEIQNVEAEIEAIENNPIYNNAFEWRFEFPEVLNDDGDFVGFDVVMGNPPYIQLQKMKEMSEQLKKFDYKTFEKTGDIYSLFYERGHRILKNNGLLCFITSNKWMRAGYGRTTRNFFLRQTQPLLLVDLGSGIFEEATVDSNILLFAKQAYSKAFEAIDLSKEKNIPHLYNIHSKKENLNPQLNESWTIANPIELSIKNKIEQLGTPLKEWDIKINRGIVTGYNEAFIIDGKKKEELIAQDPKSAELIKPILRGRDIKRYKDEFADLWLIYIPWHFPLHKNSNVKGASLEAEIEFKKNIPVFTIIC